MARLLIGLIVALLLIRAGFFQVGVRRPFWVFSGSSALAYWLFFLGAALILAASFAAPVLAIWFYLASAAAALIAAILEVVVRHRLGRRQALAAGAVRSGL